ncbi:MAG: class I SAM-dependent methyltransferase [Candidatus Zixiibacteriota bacterium]|nr:MAG: class I SAM-dependent methyltransferase [candidate division Zixibacteria bacterium]
MYEGIDKYLLSIGSEFWRRVFRAETEYLALHLRGCREILSVGCGPAIVERGLAARGFAVTGMDVSPVALACAPDEVRTVVGRAEEMDFPPASFDAAIYVVALQFLDDFREALARTARVLRPEGKLIALLLNPQSAFFQAKMRDPESYVQRIKHTDLPALEEAAAEYFRLRTEYFLGIEGEEILRSRDPAVASLYVIHGTPRCAEKGG